MFEPSDFSEHSFSDELEGDVATECGKCGQIEKITVFSKNPRGVVIVKFSTSYASQECVKLMDGRFFGGKKLRCYFWDGATDYTGTYVINISPTHSILICPILFYAFYSVLSYPILFCTFLSCAFHFVLSYAFYSSLFYSILFCSDTSH